MVRNENGQKSCRHSRLCETGLAWLFKIVRSEGQGSIYLVVFWRLPGQVICCQVKRVLQKRERGILALDPAVLRSDSFSLDIKISSLPMSRVHTGQL